MLLMERETERPCLQASRYNSNTLLINIMNTPSLQYTRGGDSVYVVVDRRVETGLKIETGLKLKVLNTISYLLHAMKLEFDLNLTISENNSMFIV